MIHQTKKCDIIKAVQIGNINAGKSSLLFRYYFGKFFGLIVYAGIGVDFYTKVVYQGEQEIKFQFWEYYHTENKDKVAVLALIGNKCDLEEQRQVSYQEGQNLAKSLGMYFFEVSAKTALFSFCLGLFNLRNHNQLDYYFSSRCQISCLTQIDRIFPGAVLGYPAGQNDLRFNSLIQQKMLQSFCDQQKTYNFLNGQIVPDFADVNMTNEEDQNDIQVDISPQNINSEFQIKIRHIFQRIEYQLDTNQQLQVNMASILSYLSQPSQCSYSKDVKSNLYQIWNFLSEQVYTKLFAGAELFIYVTFLTPQEYTKEQVINKYIQLVNNYKIQSISRFFVISGKFNYVINSTGEDNYQNSDNFQDYLSKLGPSNYIQVQPKTLKNFKKAKQILTNYLSKYQKKFQIATFYHGILDLEEQILKNSPLLKIRVNSQQNSGQLSPQFILALKDQLYLIQQQEKATFRFSGQFAFSPPLE
ncbi:hypothetical protein ABPG72_000396 [Tetrahymena utriculariae]